MCLGLSAQVHKQTARCLLPLVKDWGILGHVRHWQLVYRSHILVVVINLEVLRNIRVFLAELFELFVCDWLILPFSVEFCQQVGLRDLTLVLAFLRNLLDHLRLCFRNWLLLLLLFCNWSPTLLKQFDDLRLLLFGGFHDQG